MTDDGDEQLRALPVLIAVSHSNDGSVHRYVDGVLGWQPVGHDFAGPLRARVQITDDPSLITEGLPAVLLVDDLGVSAQDAKHLAHHTTVVVCLWPSERERLPQIVTQVLSQHTNEPGVRTLTVGGASGGAGTTTVALILGGLSAWHGRCTLVAINDRSARARSVAQSALTDPALWEQATAVAGLDSCRVVRVDDGPPVTRVRDLRISQTVYDVGVADDVDVLVLRPDRAGLYALSQTTAALVVVVGDGVLARQQIATQAGSRRVIHVAHSMRVARAVAAERLPTGVPGRWLTPLAALVRSGEVFANG